MSAQSGMKRVTLSTCATKTVATALSKEGGLECIYQPVHPSYKRGLGLVSLVIFGLVAAVTHCSQQLLGDLDFEPTFDAVAQHNSLLGSHLDSSGSCPANHGARKESHLLQTSAKSQNSWDPETLKDQTLTVLKLDAENGLFWYFINYQTITAAFIANNNDFPTRVVSPNGVTVDTYVHVGKVYQDNSKMFMTVTDTSANYFNLPLSTWNVIKQLPVNTKLSFKSTLSILNGYIMLADGSPSSAAIKKQNIKVDDTAAFDTIVSQLTVQGVAVKGDVATSPNGYGLVNFTSGTSSGQDTYRVCIYCIRQEWRGSIPEWKGVQPEPQTTTPRNFIAHPEQVLPNLEENFWKFRFQMTQFVWIPNVNVPTNNVWYFYLGAEDFLVIDRTEMAAIAQLHLDKKLKKVWFKKPTNPLVENQTGRLYVVLGSTVLEVVEDTFIEFGKDPTSEPEVSKIKAKPVTNMAGKAYMLLAGPKNTFTIRSNVAWQWYLASKSVPLLFAESPLPGLADHWPTTVANIHGVSRKLFINVAAVSKALSGTGGAQYEPLKQFLSGRTKEYTFKAGAVPDSEGSQPAGGAIKVDVSVSFPKPDDPVPNNLVDTDSQDQIFKVNTTCVELLFDLNIPGSFVKLTPDVKRDAVSQKVTVRGTVYLASLFEIKKALRMQTTAKEAVKIDADKRMKALECLKMESILVPVTKPNQRTTIPISKTLIYSGNCNGLLQPDVSCKGEFTGDISNCENSANPAACTSGKVPVTCKGMLTGPVGCDGALKAKVNINNVLLDVESLKGGNLGSNSIKGVVTIKQSNSSRSFTATCAAWYQTASTDCKVATVEIETTQEGGVKRAERYSCAGILNLASLACKGGKFHASDCNSTTNPQDTKNCDGGYLSRVCGLGGSLASCNPVSSKDTLVDCADGSWDGSKCHLDNHVIAVGDKSYYSSRKCRGKYSHGVSCNGEYDGQKIVCPDIVNVDDSNTLCGSKFATEQVYCKGLLTKNSCDGVWEGAVVIKSKTFKASAFGGFSGGLLKGNPLRLALIKDSNSHQDNWVVNVLNIDSEGQCNTEEGYCSGSKVMGTAYYQKSRTFFSMECPGKLDVSTLTCEGHSTLETCSDTVVSANPLPGCTGNFRKTTCSSGASLNGCKSKSDSDTLKVCEEAEWTGTLCTKKRIIFPLNKTAFVSGLCDGDYVEHQSCSGSFKAEIFECPDSYLTKDVVCSPARGKDFKCEGSATKSGCKGFYKGFVIARGAQLELSTKKDGKTSFFQSTTPGYANLTFYSSLKSASSSQKIPQGTDDSMLAECHKGFDLETKICRDAYLNFTQVGNPNKTKISIRCESELNIETLTCSSNMSLWSCIGESPFSQGYDLCEGDYSHLKCLKGGDHKSCQSKSPSDEEVTCEGRYFRGVCKPYSNPQLPIIMINSSYYVKGSCNAKILNNKCKGQFNGSTVVSCEGDPLNNQTDYDACKPIAQETFGSCVGEMNTAGCKGTYTQKVSISGAEWILTTKGSYDTKLAKGRTTIEKPESGSLTNYTCYDSLDIRGLVCKNGNYKSQSAAGDSKILGFSKTVVQTCTGSLKLDDFSCTGGAHTYFDCLGKSQYNKKVFTCLGDLDYAICTQGGKTSTCTQSDNGNKQESCKQSFFDGKKCLGTEPAANTKISIKYLGTQSIKDRDENTLNIANFNVEEFRMFGANVKSMIISNNTLTRLDLASGVRDSNDNIANISISSEAKRTTFDEGKIESVAFTNFAFDELPLRNFAVDDTCKVIKITFKSFVIEQLMVHDLKTKNSLVQNLRLGKEVLGNYFVEEISIPLAYGQMTVRNVVTYLPYLSASTLDGWAAQKGQISANFQVPLADGIDIAQFVIKFTAGDKPTIYFEFPEFKLAERPLDEMRLLSYTLGATDLKTDKAKGENNLKAYEATLKESATNLENAQQLAKWANE